MKGLFLVPDMSHHQSGNELAIKWLQNNACPYIIFKATEGETYRDKELIALLDKFMKRHIELCSRTVTIGLYHFCRLDNKRSMQTAAERAKAEMHNFFSVISTVRDYLNAEYSGQIPYMEIVPILDWEANSLCVANRDTYLLKCVEESLKYSGTMPIIYCSSSVTNSMECKTLRTVYPAIGLWVAHYGKNKPTVYTWHEWVAWQFTSTPFDLSFVNETFNDYAIKHINKQLINE